MANRIRSYTGKVRMVRGLTENLKPTEVGFVYVDEPVRWAALPT
ncbi:MAG: hypothetical protein RMX96_10635 [Nostoc sp. ChiSLP02]|nr:hypothetical protein [Nostoc sp. DedSLP05]MDZ8101420.1 hypothetical protein [Nostoc sp. DedSLP01]MDZ8185296.1 hypothetical protein [Nostoc sp. ChiSLP02]